MTSNVTELLHARPGKGKTPAMEAGMGHVPVVPFILAVIIIGAAIYVIRRRRRNPPNGHDE
jgi:hypothetical protein